MVQYYKLRYPPLKRAFLTFSQHELGPFILIITYIKDTVGFALMTEIYSTYKDV